MCLSRKKNYQTIVCHEKWLHIRIHGNKIYKKFLRNFQGTIRNSRSQRPLFWSPVWISHPRGAPKGPGRKWNIVQIVQNLLSLVKTIFFWCFIDEYFASLRACQKWVRTKASEPLERPWKQDKKNSLEITAIAAKIQS